MTDASYRRALKDAKRSCSALLEPSIPLQTNLWALTKLKCDMFENNRRYVPVNQKRNPSLKDVMRDHVAALDVRSLEYIMESDYFNKIDVVRNTYLPGVLRQQGDVCAWFLEGKDSPTPMVEQQDAWFERYVPENYRVLQVSDIKCPKYDASGGLCYVRHNGDYRWEYLASGPNWEDIQAGTEEWQKLVIKVVPKEWATIDLRKLIKENNYALEKLATERPVIRAESGPTKTRWARSSPKNLYILGRRFMQSIQDSTKWNSSIEYIGKASNVQYAAITRSRREGVQIGTHGDDWVAWCDHCKVFHSGDWSNWDLHVAARQILSAYQSYRKAIDGYLEDDERRLFAANAYLAIRAPTLWLWDKNGNPSMTVRRTLGKVRSGSGDFVMCPNNVTNNAGLQWIFSEIHDHPLRYGLFASKPCKSRRFWTVFSNIAKERLGWVAKPTSQITHPHGLVACRAYHTEERHFRPVPTGCSVVRNWYNAHYDPCEWPNNSELWMVARFREFNLTMAWSPWAESVMNCAVDMAVSAGVDDPFRCDKSEAEIGRAILQVAEKYNARSYLQS